MKLRIPAILRAAVLVTVIGFSVNRVCAESINLTIGTTTPKGEAGNKPGKYTHDGDLVVENSDRVGYIDDNGVLYSKFVGSQATQDLIINGDLTIQGSNAKVAVGGSADYDGNPDKDKPTMAKLQVSGNVTVKDNGYLAATKTNLGSLTVESGTVELHVGAMEPFGQGNDGFSTTDSQSGKQAYIKGELKVNGGSVSAGSTATYFNYNSPTQTKHCTTGFNGGITQTGGTISVRGDSVINDHIVQSGDKESTIYFTDDLTINSSTFKIEQSNDNAKLIIGRLAHVKTGWSAASKTVNVIQSGNGYIQLAQGSRFSKDSTINIIQSGNGTIDVGGLISKETAQAAGRNVGYENVRPNKFTSDYTTYTIDQRGATGTINVKNAITVSELKLDTGATLNLTSKLTLTDTDIDVFVTGNTDKGIVLGSNGSLELTEATVSFHLSEAAIGGWFAGIEESTITQTITLMSGMSDDFAATLLGEGGLISMGDIDIASTELTRAFSGVPEYYDIKNVELMVNKVDNVNKLQAVVTIENIENVPEPTTATLSLLALAALAARRRRK